MWMMTVTNSAVKLKSVFSTAGIGLAGLVGFQALDPSLSLQSSVLERVLREGGFFGLVLMLLFFYRRDTKWATEFWKEEASARAVLIRENTKAQADVAAALAQNNVIVHQAKRVLETFPVPHRRADNGEI